MRGKRVWSVVLVSTVVVIAVAGVAILVSLMPPPDPSAPPPTQPPTRERTDCPRSIGLCVEGEVTRVIDGDTLEVGEGLRIRLVLVDAPGLSRAGGPEARDHLADLCLDSVALVDEDDFQIGEDPFDRILAVVYCEGTNANAAMIASGLAQTYLDFCASSEFGEKVWSGCPSSPPPPPPPPPPPSDCDPAYPDVCIPSPPPDLDCADIPHRNFRVLPPDPHHFDGDGDGIGCET